MDSRERRGRDRQPGGRDMTAVAETMRTIARMAEPVRTGLPPFDAASSGPVHAPWLRVFKASDLAERDLAGKAERYLRITGPHDPTNPADRPGSNPNPATRRCG